MKLGAEVLEAGRQRIRELDLEGFVSWARANTPLISEKVLRDTYSLLFQHKEAERGLRLFEKVFPEYDGAATVRVAFLKVVARGIVFLGALGGLVYLLRSCGALG